MDLLWPRMSRANLVATARLALIGAAAGAVYGALHDQVSFAISPEYFTRLKFEQCAWADAGLPPRALASVVGALGAWWAGAVAGWFLGRGAFPEPSAATRHDLFRAFAIVAGVAVLSGAVGAALGAIAARGDLTGWDAWRAALGLRDVPAFVVAAYLHWASYLGAVLGLVIAIADARRRRVSGSR